MRCAFDADVLIYAVEPGNPFADSIGRLLYADDVELVGSVLLLPEVLAKPARHRRHEETSMLLDVLDRIELFEVSNDIADAAVRLRARYRLKTVDAVHLATAATLDADVLLTNNRKDFRASEIGEVGVIYPDQIGDLPS